MAAIAKGARVIITPSVLRARRRLRSGTINGSLVARKMWELVAKVSSIVRGGDRLFAEERWVGQCVGEATRSRLQEQAAATD